MEHFHVNGYLLQVFLAFSPTTFPDFPVYASSNFIQTSPHPQPFFVGNKHLNLTNTTVYSIFENSRNLIG